MSIIYISHDNQTYHENEDHKKSIIRHHFENLLSRVYKHPIPRQISQQKMKDLLDIVSKEFSVVIWTQSYEHPASVYDDDQQEDSNNESYDTPVDSILNALQADGVPDAYNTLSNSEFFRFSVNLYYGEFITYYYVVIPLKK